MLPPGLEPKRKAFYGGLDFLPWPDAGGREMGYKREETTDEQQIF